MANPKVSLNLNYTSSQNIINRDQTMYFSPSAKVQELHFFKEKSQSLSLPQ
jgi:hypothetical protein